MKTYLFLTLRACFFLFILTPAHLTAQWQKLGAPGITGVGLLEGNGALYTVVSSGALLYSNDIGLNWQPVAASPLLGTERYLSIDADDNLMAVLTLDETAFAVRAVQSTDGAQSWQALPALPGSNTFSDQIFVRDGNIYCLRRLDDKLYRYDSGASTWILSLAGWMLDYGFHKNTIWAARNDGKLLYSPDRGVSWQTLSTPFTDASSVEADDNRVVVGAGSKVYSSSDNGVTWSASTLPPSNYNARIYADDGAFYVVFTWTGAGEVYRSTDGFQSHQLVFSGISAVVDWAVHKNSWVISTTAGLYRSPQDPAAWLWLPAGITLNDYLSLFSAGGALFYVSNQTAFSTDRGDSWQVTDGQHWFPEVLFNNGIWYATERTGHLWQSTNLKDWTEQTNTTFPPSNEILPTWLFAGNAMLFLSHYPTLDIYVSTDYGQNWQATGAIPASVSFVDQMFVQNGTIFIYASDSGKLFKSNDYGASWQLTASVQDLSRFYTAPGKIYALSNTQLLSSTDGGFSWTTNSLQAVNPASGNIERAVAFDGGFLVQPSANLMYLTTDDGASWLPVSAGFTGKSVIALTSIGNTVFAADEQTAPWRRDQFIVNVAQYGGRVYRDLNTNGLYDAGEPGLPNAILQLTGVNQFATPVADGTFAFLVEAQNDQLKAFYPNQYCSFTPASYTVHATNTQLDFGLNCPPGITDLSVNLESSTVFRPGFDTDLAVTVHNPGVETAAGTVTLTLDPAVAFVSAVPPATQAGNTVSWTFGNFASLDKLHFSARVQTSAQTPLGAPLNFSATVTPNAADQTPADNVQTLGKTVVGSYDPNDKQVDQTAFSPDNLGNGRPLAYTIRFQNTGTYYAATVVVRDTLSPNLDPATVQVLGASHPYTWSVRGPGILEFRFNNIDLPDVNSDEAGSHGFVQFAVALRANLPLGALTQNTGHIYFDFNAPIVTNTVSTAVVSTTEPLAVIPVSVFPNPASAYLKVMLPDEAALQVPHWSVFDPSGRLVRALRADELLQGFAVGDLPAGAYRIIGRTAKLAYTAIFAVMH